MEEQLSRKSIGIELDSRNVGLIQNRLAEQRESDDVSRFFADYACTLDLEAICGETASTRKVTSSEVSVSKQIILLNQDYNQRILPITGKAQIAIELLS